MNTLEIIIIEDDKIQRIKKHYKNDVVFNNLVLNAIEIAAKNAIKNNLCVILIYDNDEFVSGYIQDPTKAYTGKESTIYKELL